MHRPPRSATRPVDLHPAAIPVDCSAPGRVGDRKATVAARPWRARPALAVAAAAALLVAAGCSSDDGADAEATTTTAAAESSSLPAGAEDLEGRWAHFDVVAYEDDTMKTLIISTGFADLEVRDGELVNQMVFCHADTANDLGTEVTFSDAATQAILPIATPVEVSGDEGSLRVVRPATPTPIGIDLEDPANESLPDDPNDPRIIDADGDGNPGVTANLKVSEDLQGELYLARREIFAYDVTQVSPDRFEGTIDDDSEQLIIGASDPLFATSSGQWTQLDDPARNPVIWVRVDDDWDCDRLAAERDALFPPNPKADW